MSSYCPAPNEGVLDFLECMIVVSGTPDPKRWMSLASQHIVNTPPTNLNDRGTLTDRLYIHNFAGLESFVVATAVAIAATNLGLGSHLSNFLANKDGRALKQAVGIDDYLRVKAKKCVGTITPVDPALFAKHLVTLNTLVRTDLLWNVATARVAELAKLKKLGVEIRTQEDVKRHIAQHSAIVEQNYCGFIESLKREASKPVPPLAPSPVPHKLPLPAQLEVRKVLIDDTILQLSYGLAGTYPEPIVHASVERNMQTYRKIFGYTGDLENWYKRYHDSHDHEKALTELVILTRVPAPAPVFQRYDKVVPTYHPPHQRHRRSSHHKH